MTQHVSSSGSYLRPHDARRAGHSAGRGAGLTTSVPSTNLVTVPVLASLFPGLLKSSRRCAKHSQGFSWAQRHCTEVVGLGRLREPQNDEWANLPRMRTRLVSYDLDRRPTMASVNEALKLSMHDR